ncbi:uncharacterized protein UBRO_06190 [Ustilago bromivora]|nr:uncharacterized protein UBRO_06190 [Ustilago bromivora]
MLSEEDRLASFATASSSTSAANKRQPTKPTASSSSSSSSLLQWPHPVTGRSAKASGIPTPAILAKHGFYHAPTSAALDAVSHFLYPDVQIDNWQTGDDPLSRLELALPNNGWCRIFRSHEEATLHLESGKWIFETPELLPTSKQMIQARKETFGSNWPYDGKKGWKPTSKKLAEAGFYFTPNQEEADNAKCIYCGKALGGWEKSDDPNHEHKRRHPECAFFNHELREPVQQEAAPVEEKDEEQKPVVATKKGGKRAVSATTRKASTKISKANKSTAAAAQDQDDKEEEEDDNNNNNNNSNSNKDVEAKVEEEPVVPPSKGGRKARGVSSRKTVAKAEVEQEEAKEAEQPAAEVEEEPVKTLRTKKSATGLGNGNQAAPARASRAASRRATKAIEILSADADVDRIPRRPDKEDLEKRELTLSDPIPFPSSPNDDDDDEPAPATDPVGPPAKAKRSRSKSKKLDQATTPKEPTPEEPTPEPEPEPEVEEDDAAPMQEDKTIVEHDASEVEEEGGPEPVEEPKRRGGRAAKASTVASTCTKTWSTATRSRKASAKVAAAVPSLPVPSLPVPPSPVPPSPVPPSPVPPSPVEVEEEMGSDGASLLASEAEVESARQRSTCSVSSALPAVPSKSKTKSSSSSDLASSTSSRKLPTCSPSSSSTKRGASSTKSTPLASEADTEVELLANTGSQATIRGTRRSSPLASSSPRPRTSCPLSQLPQLPRLDLDEAQRAMTLGEWLQMKAEAAAQEMRDQGEAGLAELDKSVRLGRIEMERRLRGRA